MSDDISISATCIISHQVVYKNEISIFENKGTDLSAFLTSAYRHLELQYPKFHKMDNLSKLGWLGTEVLLKDSFSPHKYQQGEVGVVLSNSSSSLDTDRKYYETAKDVASPALFVYTLPNIVIGEICIRHHFKGENAFFVSEKFDAGFLEQYVCNLVNRNILQACICGWVEILEEQYKTVLFLVEKSGEIERIPFTEEHINKIYEFGNG